MSNRTPFLPFRFLLLPLFFILLNGCAYGIIDDKRMLDTMASDKALATNIKTALASNDFAGGISVSVHCYYGHVFLVGEVPQSFQKKAIDIAWSKNPLSVTTHWFSTQKSADSDVVLASRLRAALIKARHLSSTRIDTEVNAGRVVLLGVVDSNEEKKIAIRTARELDGVVRVTSYLMLPPGPQTGKEAPTRKIYGAEKTKSAPAVHTR